MESADIWEEVLVEGFDLKSVYNQISIEDNFLFDGIADANFVRTIIESIFDKKFLKIDTAVLSKDITLINVSMVKLIKACLEKNFKNVGCIFIEFCDYFDLEYNYTYKNLHEKIQNKIKDELIKMIGEKKFQNMKKKTNTQDYNTLFDL